MALDFTKLRQALKLTSTEQGAPNLTLDIRIEVRGIDRQDIGGGSRRTSRWQSHDAPHAPYRLCGRQHCQDACGRASKIDHLTTNYWGEPPGHLNPL